MARVVQRRGGPPYMIILFAFLFLVSTTLAVLFYVRDDENAKKLRKEQDEHMKRIDESRKKSAVIEGLVLKIAGRALTPKAATDEAEQRLKLEYAKDYANLSSAIKGLNDQIAGLLNQVEKGKSTNSELRGEIAKKDETINNIQTGLMKQLQDVRDELSAAQKKFERDLAANKVRMDKADADFKAIIKQKDQRINALAAELDGKAMKIQQLEGRIAQLLKIVRDVKGKTGSIGEWLARRPSGKIARVFLDQDICYIGLGRKDSVTAGLPFSVFSAQTGIPKDGEPKAKIVITNVGPTTSECRIVLSNKEDPIIEGDLIINLAFSPTRTYNFVVEGEFDLYGTGKPDPLANRRVRALIESFGGKVADVISVSTDFVIMGDEPPRPPRPAEDAPPAVLRIYDDRMKAYRYYTQVKAIAISLQIPVLNTNRFLAFSGHMPKKRLTE